MKAKERLKLILKFFADMDVKNLRWEKETFYNFMRFYEDTEKKFPGYLMLVHPEIEKRLCKVRDILNILNKGEEEGLPF